MLVQRTKISGVFEITPELKEDERGYFTRIFCEEELKKQGVDFHIRQANLSFNKTKGTLRGFHFQKHPKWEAKIMAALSGSFYVAVADLRPDSKTFKQWISVELSVKKNNLLHVPIGCANAFLTLEPNSEILYLMSEFYSPEHASGFNYKDPEINVAWPFQPTVISSKDDLLPFLADVLT